MEEGVVVSPMLSLIEFSLSLSTQKEKCSRNVLATCLTRTNFFPTPTPTSRAPLVLSNIEYPIPAHVEAYPHLLSTL